MSEHINGATPGLGHNSGMTPEQELEAHSWGWVREPAKRWQDPDYVAHVDRVVALIASAISEDLELLTPDDVARVGALKPLERFRIIRASLYLVLSRLKQDENFKSRSYTFLLLYIADRCDNPHGRSLDSSTAAAKFAGIKPETARKQLRDLEEAGYLVGGAPVNGGNKPYWLPYPRSLLNWTDGFSVSSCSILDAISGPGKQGGRPKKIAISGHPNLQEPAETPGTQHDGGYAKTPGTHDDGGIGSEKSPRHENANPPAYCMPPTDTRGRSSEADADDRVPPRVGSLAGATDLDGSSSHLGGPRFAPPPSMAPAPPLVVQGFDARGPVNALSGPPPPTPAPVAAACDNIRFVDTYINNSPEYGGIGGAVDEAFVDRRWSAETVCGYVGINDRMFAKWHELNCWRPEGQPPMANPPSRETTDGELIDLVLGTCDGQSADAVRQALEQALLTTVQKVRLGDIKSNPLSYVRKALLGIANEREVEEIKQSAKKADAIVQAKAESEAALAKITAKSKADVAIEEMRPNLVDKAAEQKRKNSETFTKSKAATIGGGKTGGTRDTSGPDERPHDDAIFMKLAGRMLDVKGRHVNKLLDEIEGATTLDVTEALENLDGRNKTTRGNGKGFVRPEPISVVMQLARYIVSRTVAHRKHGTPDKHCPGAVARHDGKPIVTDWFAVSEQFIDRLLRDLPGLGIAERADKDPDLAPRDRVCKFVQDAVELHIGYRERELARDGDVGPTNYGTNFREECEAHLFEKLTPRHEAGLKAREEAEKAAAAQAEAEAKKRAEQERLAAKAAQAAKREAEYRANFGEPTKLDHFKRPMFVDPSTGRFVFDEDVVRFGEHPELVIRAQATLATDYFRASRIFNRDLDPKANWDSLSDEQVMRRIQDARASLAPGETPDTPYQPKPMDFSSWGAGPSATATSPKPSWLAAGVTAAASPTAAKPWGEPADPPTPDEDGLPF
jgi:hypothetical protein